MRCFEQVFKMVLWFLGIFAHDILIILLLFFYLLRHLHTYIHTCICVCLNRSSTLLHALAALFFLIFLLAVGHGDAGRMGGAALKVLTNGWKRKNRVALLTVATHMSRLAETSDSESGRSVHVFVLTYIVFFFMCVYGGFTNY
jgi:hypothetical protein